MDKQETSLLVAFKSNSPPTKPGRGAPPASPTIRKDFLLPVDRPLSE